MSEGVLSIRTDGAIMHVSINNPPINLMTIQMVKELFGLVGRLNFDPSVKVVIFESAVTDFFIAHFDLNDLLVAGNDPAAKGKFEDINILQSLSVSLQSLPQVTIAKVGGICRGAGLELILGMTMRFASKSARFCAPEASSGFLPCGGGSTRLAMACGPARALEIMLSARDFSGEEAQKYGVVNQALADDELHAYVEELARRIAQRSLHTIAINREVIKRTFASLADALFAGFAYENEAWRASMQLPDMPRAVQALLKAGQTRESELDLPRTIDGFLESLPSA
ncbi:Enoyl-CoA hydratase/carnithine racemase [Paraburkholderia steynii]|uniref:Enoyl-CoA hydratase/carnithine racemase n=1 Tax=Paraburkholderia steynii TaxID=1245441 RepID=A0A7Z7BG46_9BURK|nr:enoyl-CoA hydratase/isomerase family protein [Paraburkholderia steynii]SDJ15808.1 Enoyl-CoA hydratase/carnithine racemase [Paraburkholderia steynii]